GVERCRAQGGARVHGTVQREQREGEFRSDARDRLERLVGVTLLRARETEQSEGVLAYDERGRELDVQAMAQLGERRRGREHSIPDPADLEDEAVEAQVRNLAAQ